MLGSSPEDYHCSLEASGPLTYAQFLAGDKSFTYGVGWTIIAEQLLVSCIALVRATECAKNGVEPSAKQYFHPQVFLSLLFYVLSPMHEDGMKARCTTIFLP